MPYCSHCGSGLLESGRFWASCGAPNASGYGVQVTLDHSPSSAAPAPPPSSASSQSRISATSLRAESGRILPGTLLADWYRIVALVGRGGMGEVYRAQDLKLDQDVALKFLPGRTSGVRRIDGGLERGSTAICEIRMKMADGPGSVATEQNRAFVRNGCMFAEKR